MATNESIKISVIIPCYNSAGFMETGLLSVCRQSYRNFEIVISDDASTDDTLKKAEQIIKSYPDVEYQLLANEHSGPGGNRNHGIRAAKYDWVAFLDSDDYWDENKLQKIVDRQQQTDANLIFHNETFFQEGSEAQQEINYVARYDQEIPLFLALFHYNFLSPSAVVLAKKLLLDAGLFDLGLHYGEDYDLWLKISLLPETQVAFVNESLSFYQVRPESLTSNTAEHLRGLLFIATRYQSDVLRLSVNGKKELSRFKGVAYTRSGWAFCKQHKVFKGLFYIIKGLCFDMRKDLVKKIFSR